MATVWRKIMLGLMLVVLAPQAAKAQNIILWDRGIAAAVRSQLEQQESCTPYDLYRPRCAERQRRLARNHDDGPGLTLLDEVALFVYRYKDVNLKKNVQPGTQLKVTAKVPANLLWLYDQEASVRLELRIRF